MSQIVQGLRVLAESPEDSSGNGQEDVTDTTSKEKSDAEEEKESKSKTDSDTKTKDVKNGEDDRDSARDHRKTDDTSDSDDKSDKEDDDELTRASSKLRKKNSSLKRTNEGLRSQLDTLEGTDTELKKVKAEKAEVEDQLMRTEVAAEYGVEVELINSLKGGREEAVDFLRTYLQDPKSKDDKTMDDTKTDDSDKTKSDEDKGRKLDKEGKKKKVEDIDGDRPEGTGDDAPDFKTMQEERDYLAQQI